MRFSALTAFAWAAVHRESAHRAASVARKNSTAFLIGRAFLARVVWCVGSAVVCEASRLGGLWFHTGGYAGGGYTPRSIQANQFMPYSISSLAS